MFGKASGSESTQSEGRANGWSEVMEIGRNGASAGWSAIEIVKGSETERDD